MEPIPRVRLGLLSREKKGAQLRPKDSAILGYRLEKGKGRLLYRKKKGDPAARYKEKKIRFYFSQKHINLLILSL